MNITRTQNYIGRSDSYPIDPDANAIIDELKIFNRGLNQSEIENDMNN